MQLLDAIDRHDVQLRADGRSAHTRQQFARHLRLLDRWLVQLDLPRAVTGIDHEALARFLCSPEATTRSDGRPKKTTSMNTLRSSLKTFFRYARDAGWVDQNPARLIRRAQCGPPPPRAFNADDQRKLLAAFDAADSEVDLRDAMLFRLMLRTGLRVGEAVAVDIEDVDLADASIVVHGKGGMRDHALLPEDVCAKLRGFLDGRASGPLFRTRGGARRVSVRHVQRRFAAWLVRAGIERSASSHALRHTAAMNVYTRSGDILVVRRALRHRSIASSARYAQADEHAVRSAIA